MTLGMLFLMIKEEIKNFIKSDLFVDFATIYITILIFSDNNIVTGAITGGVLCVVLSLIKKIIDCI